MAESALRPRSGVEIIDGMFSLLRRDYLKFVTIMGIGYLPYLIAVMLTTRASEGNAGAAAFFGAIMMFVSMFWLNVINGAMIAAASDSYLGRPIDTAESLKRTLRRFWSVAGAGLLRVIVVFVGLLFFLVGAAWAWITFFAATSVVVLEGTGAMDGMRRSAELTRGHKWHVFGTMAVTYLIYYFLLGLAMIPSFLISSEMLPVLAGAIMTILAYPMTALVETMLYYDLRIRKEGFDIELMTRELGELPEGQPAR
jgi:hypothetical protein